jgi:hypothetical protein
MHFFCFAQSTHLRDSDFLYTSLAKLQHIIGTVVAAIRGEFLGLYAKSGFCLTYHRKQFRAVIGMAPVNLIVNDDSGAILEQLQRATKLNRLIEFPFADGPCFRVVERNNAFARSG